MCLITFAINQHPDFPFIMVANRDEFYQRPSDPMHNWQDHPQILAGRDLKQGGTWLGFNRNGRFAAVTNYRRPTANSDLLSRGALVTDALLSAEPISNYLQTLHTRANSYGLYNLLAGDEQGLYFHSNSERGLQPKRLTNGVYGLCNASLNTPWPKLMDAKAALAQIIKHQEINIDSLSQLLNQKQQAEDSQLPDTGIAIEWERALSSQFICIDGYGTRAKTIVLQAKSGLTQIREISYDENGRFAQQDFTEQLVALGSAINC